MDCSLPGSSLYGISRQEYWSGLHLSYDLANEDLKREDINVHLTKMLSEKHSASKQITLVFLQIGSIF